MAASDTDLGNIQTLLERALSEIKILREQMSLEKKSSALEFVSTPILWYDNLPPLSDISKGIHPHKNALHKNNVSLDGKTDIIHVCDKAAAKYELKQMSDWDDKYSDRQNLYFIELSQVHDGIESTLSFVNKEAIRLCKNGHMAFVWYFPHEGFSFEAMRTSANLGWMDRLVISIKEWNLETGVHFLIYNDLNAADNFKRWKRDRPTEKFSFKQVFGWDFFHDHYFRQYATRTAWRFNPTQDAFGFSQTKNYGDFISSKDREAFIEYHDLPEKVKQTQRTVSQKRAERHMDGGGFLLEWHGETSMIKIPEVMEGVPTAEEKDRELICLNARVRPHRPVIVSELDRLGYTNRNSYISFLARDEELKQNPEEHWKFKCFRNMSAKEDDTSAHWQRHVTNDYTDLMEFEIQKEHFYRFWHHHDVIQTDIDIKTVQKDDRSICVDQYRKSYFALIPETLFGAYDSRHLQLTEKIYKSIAYRTPFLVLGSPGTLSRLREIGYETFPEMFDESYDTVIDPKKRMTCIIRNLERWSSIDKNQKREIYESVRPKLQRNYDHFKSCQKIRASEWRAIFEELKLYG